MELKKYVKKKNNQGVHRPRIGLGHQFEGCKVFPGEYFIWTSVLLASKMRRISLGESPPDIVFSNTPLRQYSVQTASELFSAKFIG